MSNFDDRKKLSFYGLLLVKSVDFYSRNYQNGTPEWMKRQTTGSGTKTGKSSRNKGSKQPSRWNHSRPENRHHSRSEHTARRQHSSCGTSQEEDGEMSPSGRRLKNQQVSPLWTNTEWDNLTKELWKQTSQTGKDVAKVTRGSSAQKMVEVYHYANMGRMAERLSRQQRGMWPMVLWWIISLWIRVVESFGSNMTMAFIGRINTGNEQAIRTLLSVRKDIARIRKKIRDSHHEIERLFRTKIGNRPWHPNLRPVTPMFQNLVFTYVLWTVGERIIPKPMATALVMAWVTRNRWATIAGIVGTASATPDFVTMAKAIAPDLTDIPTMVLTVLAGGTLAILTTATSWLLTSVANVGRNMSRTEANTSRAHIRSQAKAGEELQTTVQTLGRELNAATKREQDAIDNYNDMMNSSNGAVKAKQQAERDLVTAGRNLQGKTRDLEVAVEELKVAEAKISEAEVENK